MQAMMPRPPEGTLLQSTTPNPRQHKLKRPAGLVSLVRKVSMVSGGDSEHSGEIKHYEHDPIDNVNA